ncbi:MAG: hypothetical protein B7Z55_11955 [Planctomycetales bacterium 12-60-4]|nr:MAG: hypothetical protein B7Z55_11955 [Planctomycetales bacterium 12-60-4]
MMNHAETAGMVTLELRLPLMMLVAFHCGMLAAADPVTAWRQTHVIPAAEAGQAAATDEHFVYAVNNTHVAKYDRKTGQRLAVSMGPAQHLNSAYLWDGRLYSAHSNYPKNPEHSEIKVLDLESMQLTTFHDFGESEGSLTWANRHADQWWCHFAFYGIENHRSYLARYDNQWQETGRWTLPVELIARLGAFSLSGGIWHGDELLVTGHDDPIVFRLRLPRSGHVLELIGAEPAPFTGQGIAVDPLTGGLVGIHRPKKQVLFAEPE